MSVMMADHDDVVDLIYQAPVRASAWGPVMERLGDLLGGSGAWLSTINCIDGAGQGLWVRTDPAFPQAFFSYFAARNPLNNVPDPDSFMRAWRPRIVTEDDLIDRDALRRSEFYNDFLIPLRATSVAMIRLARHEVARSTSVINIGRAPERGPFQAAELELAARFHSHLIRAFHISMGVARAQLLQAARSPPISAAGRGVVLLDASCRALSVDPIAETMLRGPELAIRRGRLAADDPAIEAGLRALAARACARPPAPRTGGVVAVPAADLAAPLVVTVTPWEDDGLGLLLSDRFALALIADPARTVKPAAQTLKAVYGFTPAEARLALALLDGDSLKETAERLGISVNTATIHLSRVFDKTGVNRQAALAGLLTRLAERG